jgi:DNA-binding CsgD family transcriptional regulator
MKKLTNTTKVLRYIQKNPNAKAKEVASAVGVSVNTVYQCTYNAKKKTNGKATTVLVSNAEMSKALFSNPPQRERLRMGEHPLLDSVNHPPHYKVGGIETIDFIEAKSLNYNLGNVIKYLTRADHKGNRKQDLEKARWYLNREIGGTK